MQVFVHDCTASQAHAIKDIIDRLNRCQNEFQFVLHRKENSLNDSSPVSWAGAVEHVRNSVRADQFVVGIIESPLEYNWFSFTNPQANCSVITTHGWDVISYLPIESFIGYEIVMNLQEALIQWEDYSFAHLEPLGCINDMCGYKPHISFKIRTGDVCPACMETWKEKLTEAQIGAFQALLDTIRGVALGREPSSTVPVEEQSVFPVAVLWRLLRQETNSARKFLRLLDLFDMAVRYSVICLVAESLYLCNYSGTQNRLN